MKKPLFLVSSVEGPFSHPTSKKRVELWDSKEKSPENRKKTIWESNLVALVDEEIRFFQQPTCALYHKGASYIGLNTGKIAVIRSQGPAANEKERHARIIPLKKDISKFLELDDTFKDLLLKALYSESFAIRSLVEYKGKVYDASNAGLFVTDTDHCLLSWSVYRATKMVDGKLGVILNNRKLRNTVVVKSDTAAFSENDILLASDLEKILAKNVAVPFGDGQRNPFVVSGSTVYRTVVADLKKYVQKQSLKGQNKSDLIEIPSLHLLTLPGRFYGTDAYLLKYFGDTATLIELDSLIKGKPDSKSFTFNGGVITSYDVFGQEIYFTVRMSNNTTQLRSSKQAEVLDTFTGDVEFLSNQKLFYQEKQWSRQLSELLTYVKEQKKEKKASFI